MRHPTRAEAKRIQEGNEVPVFIEKTVLPLYKRFAGRDFEAKEGAMEYCWNLIRKKIAELCSITKISGTRRAMTPEQNATKLVANERVRI
jgi:hypothetical protein